MWKPIQYINYLQQRNHPVQGNSTVIYGCSMDPIFLPLIMAFSPPDTIRKQMTTTKKQQQKRNRWGQTYKTEKFPAMIIWGFPTQADWWNVRGYGSEPASRLSVVAGGREGRENWGQERVPGSFSLTHPQFSFVRGRTPGAAWASRGLRLVPTRRGLLVTATPLLFHQGRALGAVPLALGGVRDAHTSVVEPLDRALHVGTNKNDFV